MSYLVKVLIKIIHIKINTLTSIVTASRTVKTDKSHQGNGYVYDLEV